jgi:transposase-like protein
MDKYDVAKQLMQVETTEGSVFLRDWMRGQVLQAFLRVMEAEVESLCGAMHRPEKDSGFYRAGSAPGAVLDEGKKVKVNRPRVRRKKTNESVEVRLSTYEAGRDPGRLEEMFLRALCAGVSTREQKNVYPGSQGNSRSNISRLWAREGEKLLEEFRTRDIQRDDWLVLMLDGVCLTKEFWAIVALGVADDGTKHMLDFEIGASENTEIVTALCERLRGRGFAPKDGCRLLCVFDGAKALRKASKKVWGDPVLQRCLVHKERNLRRYLSKRHWGELGRLMKRLRKVQGETAAREVLAELRSFVASKNAQALESLDEAGEELIALHLLEVPSTLHRNLLSTNIIENGLRNVRGKTGRVTRWRKETNQAPRWIGMALTEIEKGFRKLAGFRDLPALTEALRRSHPRSDSSPAAAA